MCHRDVTAAAPRCDTIATAESARGCRPALQKGNTPTSWLPPPGQSEGGSWLPPLAKPIRGGSMGGVIRIRFESLECDRAQPYSAANHRRDRAEYSLRRPITEETGRNVPRGGQSRKRLTLSRLCSRMTRLTPLSSLLKYGYMLRATCTSVSVHKVFTPEMGRSGFEMGSFRGSQGSQGPQGMQRFKGFVEFEDFAGYRRWPTFLQKPPDEVVSGPKLDLHLGNLVEDILGVILHRPALPRARIHPPCGHLD
eukprot:1192405-Prorocentrum_minimum.AAC.1